MDIKPLSGAIGAEITGVNLPDASAAEHQQIEAAFVAHHVLCFRDQRLEPADLLALTRQLGGPGETPYLTGMVEYPDVVSVVKEADERSPHTFGAGWHTDFTFQAQPPSRTLLYAVDTPDVGGDTLYCNLYKAYDNPVNRLHCP